MNKNIILIALMLVIVGCNQNKMIEKNDSSKSDSLKIGKLYDELPIYNSIIKEFTNKKPFDDEPMNPKDSTYEYLKGSRSPYPPTSDVFLWGKLRVATNEEGIPQLCDSIGTPRQLRGVSSHGLQWASGANITRANINTLANDWRCNVFRLAIHINEEGGYFSNPGRTHRILDSVVIRCANAGIYCIIDCHVETPGNPNDSTYRYSEINPALFAKEIEFDYNKYSKKERIDLSGSLFRYCAKRYKHFDHIIYEVCSNPNDKGNSKIAYSPVTWKYDIRPYCEDMLKIIRDVDSTVPPKIVICGTPQSSQSPQDVIGVEPQDKKGNRYTNVMYSLQIGANAYSKKNPDMRAILKNDSTSIADSLNSIWRKLPLFVSGWMTTNDETGWNSFDKYHSNKLLELLYKKNYGKVLISWCNWALTSSEETGECGILKWHSGRIPEDSLQRDKILTESGKYIREQLRHYRHRDSLDTIKQNKIKTINIQIQYDSTIFIMYPNHIDTNRMQQK